MKLKVLLAGLIILMISLYSCEDKTQTTQTQTKSDVNNILTISNNDSIAALQFLPYLLGKINATDSIVEVEHFVVFRDSVGRRFISLIYINVSSESKMYVYNYYNEYDSDVDEETAAIGSVFHKGARFQCTGTCNGGQSNCSFDVSTGKPVQPSDYVCNCGGVSDNNCVKQKINVTLTNSDAINGYNVMSNITIDPIFQVAYTIEVIE